MKKIIFLLLLLTAGWAFAQKVRITGTVYDKETKEKLIGAQVYETLTGKGTITNDFGYFSLIVPKKDNFQLIISYLGYKTKMLLLPPRGQYQLKIELEPGEQLNEVVISLDKQPQIERNIEVSKISLDAKQVAEIPVIMSEPDLIKAVQKLPGVEPGVEGFGGMYVRGGSIDQNLILLDDVPLYYINHLGGFLSVFNTDAINKVTLYKAGFPAKYGERLSSVLDIRMRDGNKKEFHGSFMAGVLSWKFNLEGPIIKDKTSFIISLRRFPYDLLLRTAGKLSSQMRTEGGYTFYDINMKLNHQLNENDQLYLSWYFGDDALSFSEREKDYKFRSRLGWGNHLISLKWARLWGHRWFMNTTGSYTRYRFGVTIKEKEIDSRMKLNFFSGIIDYRLKTDLESNVSEKVKLKTGAGYTYYIFKPGVAKYTTEGRENNQITDTVLGQVIFNSANWHTYVSALFKISEKFETEIGLRGNLYTTRQSIFPSLEPRINLKYMTGENSSVKLSYMEVQQNVHLLTSGNIGTPVDMWMPATDLVPPGKSRQIAGGYYHTFLHGEYDMSVEAYYKTMNNLIAYKPGTSFMTFAFEDWEYVVEKNGTGRSYGAELLLRKKKGKFRGWLAYAWAKSTRQFHQINNGKPYPFKFDRRHSLDITGSYHFKPGKVLSISWAFGSGYPITLPVGTVEYANVYEETEPGNGFFIVFDHIVKEKNNYRMRAYHRLDVSMRFTKKKKRGERTWILGVYNVYNRQNPMFYQLEYTENGMEVYQFSLFPFLPSISYSYRF